MVLLGAGRRQERRGPSESFWEASGVEIEKLTLAEKNVRHGLTWIFGSRGGDLDFWASRS